MARVVKARRKKDLKRQNSADANVEEEVIEELEDEGDLKKDVPVGGEEYENEEPRQGK